MGTGLVPFRFYSTKVAKSLIASNIIIGHGKVPYQKPRLKSMVHGVYPRIAQCISAMRGCQLNVRGV